MGIEECQVVLENRRDNMTREGTFARLALHHSVSEGKHVTLNRSHFTPISESSC